MGIILNRRRVMGGKASNPFIQFADAGTKAFCVEKFGGADGGTLTAKYRKNGVKVPGVEGELTYEQAASIIHVYNQVFFNKTTLGSFDEFQFFTGFTSVEFQAFFQSSITSIIVPDTVTRLLSRCFYNCRQLQIVTLPESITSIADESFYGCSNLAEINIPNTVRRIGNSAFLGCRTLSSIVLPEGISTINASTFSSCTSLKSCNIPSSVQSIGQSAFQGAPLEGHLEIPYGVTTIGYGTFWNCQIESVTIPESVTTIDGARAFCCPKLKSVTLPSSLEVLGHETFYGCSSLAEIKVLATTPPSGVDRTTWQGVPASTKIQVPAESVDAYKADSGWGLYASRIIAIEE